MPNSIGEKNDVPAGAYKEGKFFNSEILNEMVDISFEISHGISFQRFFEDQFDSMLEELHFGWFSFGKQGTEYFYDLVAEYMEGLGNGNG